MRLKENVEKDMKLESIFWKSLKKMLVGTI